MVASRRPRLVRVHARRHSGGVGVGGDTVRLTPEQQNLVDRVEADIEQRVERRLRRRSWIRALGYVVAIAIIALAARHYINDGVTQNCRARREARTSIIDLVHVAVQGAPPDSPGVVRLNNAIRPGGPLGPLNC